MQNPEPSSFERRAILGSLGILGGGLAFAGAGDAAAASATTGSSTPIRQPINGSDGRGSPLKLLPLGQLALHIDQSWQMNGPIWTRSVSAMKYAEWSCELFRLRSLWANGSYQMGKDVAQVTVRALFEDQDGVKLFLDYLVRTDMPLHVQGKHPVIMSGRIEADEAIEKYRWLNRTQVVGKGYLSQERRIQTYDMYALAWD